MERTMDSDNVYITCLSLSWIKKVITSCESCNKNANKENMYIGNSGLGSDMSESLSNRMPYLSCTFDFAKCLKSETKIITSTWIL